MQEIPQTVAEAYIRTTRRLPDKEAVVSADGRRYTYDQVRREVEKLTTALHTLGCQPGDRVAVWLSNCPEWVFAEFACAVLGVLIVPVNARFRAGEAAYILKSARAKVLITQTSFLTNNYLDRLYEMAGGNIGHGETAEISGLPDLRSVVLVDGEAVPGTVSLDDLLARAGEANVSLDFEALAAARRPEDPAWIFWTSGTTGHPKGAVLPHHCISNVWNWTTMAAGMDENDRVLTTFPVFYVGGNFWCILAAMVHGATLVMSATFDADAIVQCCREENITVLSGIPFMLKEIVHDPMFDPDAFASVRVGFFGGASMPHADIVTLVERIGYKQFIQIYGMTELHGISMTSLVTDSQEHQLTTCGRSLPGFELQLVDPESGEVVEGVGTGEAWYKGRTHLGYEGLTEEELDQFYTEDGFFKTGDVLHRRSDDRYEFVTRVKDLIKVGGENVAAVEIENVLKNHPKVFNIQVVGVVDDRRGEVPAAFVELQPEATDLSLDELRQWAGAKMAPFKVPRRLKLMAAEDWPRTSSAKIARFQLAALLT
ncbi:MAG: class I adenylate-forming enzyme family protein [Alphaproteobacteria bacterium]|jgi:fatty-acyl-CoA synthase|nr:class I adenylate-forming enzyme family protein [Alphaproteobacteria bacterium]